MIYLTVGFFGLLAWNIISDLLWRKEFRKLFDRLMAKSYQEYKYYDSQYPDDMKALKKLRKDEFQKIDKEDDVPISADMKQFLDKCEEDWNPYEIDTEALEKVINESEKDRKDNSGR